MFAAGYLFQEFWDVVDFVVDDDPDAGIAGLVLGNLGQRVDRHFTSWIMKMYGIRTGDKSGWDPGSSTSNSGDVFPRNLEETIAGTRKRIFQ